MKFVRKRAGKLARLNAECKAFQSSTDAAMRQYDGHNALGPDGQASVSWAVLKATGPLLKLDSVHDVVVYETENPIQAGFSVNPIDSLIQAKEAKCIPVSSNSSSNLPILAPSTTDKTNG